MGKIKTLNDAIESISLFYAKKGNEYKDFVSLYNGWSKSHYNHVKNPEERNVLLSYCHSLVETERDAVEKALV